ncbi:MAG: type II secretion system protein [Elusimicrobia bacterium]|nr:type II secretion system protein [Elusimicrobiota bacterium]
MKSKKGFTLIELLIVMAIIAILIGISLPRFRGMQDEGQKSRARSNLATVRTAVEAYAAAPRSNGLSKYPDNGADTAPQQNAGAALSRVAGTGWETTRLMVAWVVAGNLGTRGPVMLATELFDPFSPAAGNVEYGYYQNSGYYVIWSNGTGRVNTACTISNAGLATIVGTSVFVTNGRDANNQQSN